MWLSCFCFAFMASNSLLTLVGKNLGCDVAIERSTLHLGWGRGVSNGFQDQIGVRFLYKSYIRRKAPYIFITPVHWALIILEIISVSWEYSTGRKMGTKVAKTTDINNCTYCTIVHIVQLYILYILYNGFTGC